MSRYDLLQEFNYVKAHCPKGIYLIPVPPKLHTSNSTPSRIQFESKADPWQGIIFIRNPESPYFNGAFRFELNFAQFAQIRQYLQPSATPTNRPYSYSYYPIMSLQSELHSVNGQEKHIAEYCLDGIEKCEQDYIARESPFSRVVYVLERLRQWFDGVGVEHDVNLASTDVKVSKSDTLLYEQAKGDENRLIMFSPEKVTQEVVDILKSS